MIRFHALVFDEYLLKSTPVYTSVHHMEALGQGNQIGLHAVCDKALAAATLTAAIEHSTDGRNWSPKSAAPEINGVAFNANQATSIYGCEPYLGLRSLELVRVRITVSSNRGVRVRLYAAVRDRVTGRYAACGCASEEEPRAIGEHERRAEERRR